MAEVTIREVDERLSEVAPTAVVSGLAVVGSPGEWRDRASKHPAIVKDDATIREHVRVHAGCERPTVIGERTLLMSGSHVGHDAQLGADCEVAPNAVIGGLVTIGDRVKVGMGAVIRPHVIIGADARVGMGAVVLKDIPAGQTWVGNSARRIR